MRQNKVHCHDMASDYTIHCNHYCNAIFLCNKFNGLVQLTIKKHFKTLGRAVCE